MWLLILILLAGAAAAAWFFLLDHRTSVQIMEAEDGQDPIKRWARAAYVIVNGKFDPGSMNPGTTEAAHKALQRDWGVTDPTGVGAKLVELSQSPSGNVAWDQVRRIVLARMAASAGFIPQEASWSAIQQSKPALNSRYSGWEEVAADYRQGLAAWSQNDSERLAMFDLYAKEVGRPLWQVVSFR